MGMTRFLWQNKKRQKMVSFLNEAPINNKIIVVIIITIKMII